jgi:hypothetical protein
MASPPQAETQKGVPLTEEDIVSLEDMVLNSDFDIDEE